MEFKSWYLQQTLRMRFRYAMLGIALFCAVALFVLYYTGRASTYYHDPTRTNAEGRVVILVTDWCPYCKLLKRRLTEANFPFDEIDVEKDWTTRAAHRSTKRRGIPVTIIGREVVAGGTDKQLAAIRATCEKAALGPNVHCDKLR